MEGEDHIERAHAVLMRLRDQLLDHQQRLPNPQTLVPADHAEHFNDVLAELEDVYGAPWVASLSISRWAIIPASVRAGGSPAVASVSRETLLGHLQSALRRLQSDTPLPKPTALEMPRPATVAVARYLTSGPPRSSPPPSGVHGSAATPDPGNL